MFFKMAKVHYFLRSNNNKSKTSSLYCRITHNKSICEFSTKEVIDRSEWNQTAQKMKGNSLKANYINTFLEKLTYKIKIQSITLKAYTAKELLQKIREADKPQLTLIEIVESYIESVKGKVKPGTLKNHEIKLQNLKAYQEEKGFIFYPDNFSLVEAEAFIEWFKNKAKTTNVTTASRNISFYKMALNYGLKTGLISNHLLLHYQTQKDKLKQNIFLSLEELTKIKNFKPKNRQLTRIKDVFLFQCYTGLSYADVWNDWEIKSYKNTFLIYGIRAKNGQSFFIPLSVDALDILNKYPEGLPKYHNVVYNRILKEIAALCGIEKRITTHTGRKTFATIQDSLGWSRESISRMLGHRSIKTTETYYIGETDQRLLEEIRKKAC